MYIPTQEERYAKKGFISLLLCVIVPSCLYVTMLADQLTMIRGQEWDAILHVVCAFSYPLAAVFAILGLPFFWWAVMLASLIHIGLVIWLKMTKKLKPKQAICIALCVGMLDFFLLKLFPFPADVMV